MRPILKSNYQVLLKYPLNIIHKSLNILQAYLGLDRFQYNWHLKGVLTNLNIYTTITHEDDDEEDQLADEGGIDYYNEANEKAYDEASNATTPSEQEYWKHEEKITNPFNTHGLRDKAVLVLAKNGFGKDFFRKLSQTDLVNIAHNIQKMIKQTYQPIDLNNYLLVITGLTDNGFALATKNHTVLNIMGLHDLSGKYSQFDTSVLFKKSDLASVYNYIKRYNPLHSDIFVKQAKLGTKNADILAKVYSYDLGKISLGDVNDDEF